ncbi:unnamed protein product, partial [marine sediment metagenome]
VICKLWCSYTYYKMFIPSKANLEIKNKYGLKPKIKFLDTCNKCGQCAKNCLYGALTIKESVK